MPKHPKIKRQNARRFIELETPPASLAMKVGAGINALYFLAGLALFATGEAPVITPSTDFLGDKFAMAWAAWKFLGCLYFALVNFQVSLPTSNVVVALGYIAVDVFAAQDTVHWTPLAWSFVACELIVVVSSLKGSLLPGAVINALYTLAGTALFLTGEAPVITPSTDFLGDKFAMAWAGWKFTGCLYFALINFKFDIHLCNAVAMALYVAFDIFAAQDTVHWTPLAWSFVALDGTIGILSAAALLGIGGRKRKSG